MSDVHTDTDCVGNALLLSHLPSPRPSSFRLKIQQLVAVLETFFQPSQLDWEAAGLEPAWPFLLCSHMRGQRRKGKRV